MSVTSLYICPWSLSDPLCQSQCLPYLIGLTALGHSFALITFENPTFATPDIKGEKMRLQQAGIYWYPIPYHVGTSIVKKGYDVAIGFAVGAKIIAKHRPRIIHSRSSLSLPLAISLVATFRLKFLYDADSMLSEEYADIGHWSPDSRGYRIMFKSESIARRLAHQIIVLTEVLREDIQNQLLVERQIEVIPCCVDMERFRFCPVSRETKREELKIRDEILLVYVGKIGTWYLVDEVFDFLRTARSKVGSVKLLFITKDRREDIDSIARRRGVRSDSYMVVEATRSEIPQYLSASDIGLSLIKSLPSKRGSSPIKVAEYLSSGLPTVITDKIGDYSELIAKNEVGVTLRSLDEDEYLAAFTKLRENLLEPNGMRVKCQSIAKSEASLTDVGIPRYERVYNNLVD